MHLAWKEGLPFLLYQDGLKKQEQQPLRKLMEEILLFSLTKELLEEVLEPEKELVVELVEEIKLPWAYAHGISLIQASLVQHPPCLAPRCISLLLTH